MAGQAQTSEPPTILDFTFTDMKGAGRTLSQFKGNVVLLDFWASWCIPCRKSVPFLDQLQEKHEARGLKVVAVTLETDDDAVAGFISANPSRFLVGRDPTGRAGELFEVAAMPTAVLLDRAGRVLARFEGGGDSVHQRIEQAVEAAMRGELAPVTADAGPRRGPKGNLRAWDRGYLADPIMSLDGDRLTRSMKEHIHSSKEAAAGDGGVSGGGCGCN
jgi:thiol-disulfide isomerase/thioredoxin